MKDFLTQERNLVLRTFSAFVMVSLTLWALFFAPRSIQIAILALIYTALIYEWHAMNHKRPASSLYWAGHLYIAGAMVGLYKLIQIQPLLLLFLILVWSNDIFAYATGRLVGGPKLWPQVSPSKTWAGFVGGTLLGTVTAWGYSVFIFKPSPFSFGTLILFSILSHGGDLLESACKRFYGVKDSSKLIPGHGGALDRLDSILCVSLAHMLLNWAFDFNY